MIKEITQFRKSYKPKVLDGNPSNLRVWNTFLNQLHEVEGNPLSCLSYSKDGMTGAVRTTFRNKTCKAFSSSFIDGV